MKKSNIYIIKGPKVGKKNWAEIIFEVIMATDCPRRGFDRVRAENFQKRFKDISS